MPASSTSGPAIPAAVTQQRCPDCGRLVSGGDCIACGWRQAPAPSDHGLTPPPVTGVNKQPDDLGPGPAPSPALPPPQPQAPPSAPSTSAGGLAARTPMVEAPAPAGMAELSVPLPRLIAVAAATFLLTVGIGSIFIFSGGTPEGSAEMSREEAAEILVALERLDNRSGEQWRSLGYAYFSLERYEDGLDAFGKAGKLGAVDEEAVEQVIEILNDPLLRDRTVKTLIDLQANSGVDAVLGDTLEHPRLQVRHAALKALKRRGSLTSAQHVTLLIKDLLEAGTCDQRREALVELGGITTGEDRARVIEAIQQAETTKTNQLGSCMLPHFKRVKEAIMKR